MTKQKTHRIHLLYGVILSILLIVSGICLIIACLGICCSGEQPFSRESVAAAFSPIAVPILLTVALVIIGFFLDLFLPKDKKSATALQYSMTLKRLQGRADFSKGGPHIRRSVRALRSERKLYKLTCTVLLALESLVFLSYALLEESFHATRINDSVIRAMIVLLPCMAIPFAFAVFAAFHARKSMKQEIELLRQLPTRKARPVPPRKADRSLLIIRSVLLCIGIAALLFGLFSGGTADVLTKAINICTECVGLG